MYVCAWMVIYGHACIPPFYDTITTCEQVKIALRSLREVLAESATAHKAPGNPGNICISISICLCLYMIMYMYIYIFFHPLSFFFIIHFPLLI